MNYRLCIIVFIELVFLALPANLIGCLDPPDPYDDYISFFRNDLAPGRAYRPFYYVNDVKLYDELGTDSVDRFAAAWARYCGVTVSQARRFLYQSTTKDIDILLDFQHEATALRQPSLVLANAMGSYLHQHRELEALEYLHLVKQFEARVATEHTDPWRRNLNPPDSDSAFMSRLLDTAINGYRKATKPFIRTRYAFYAVKLAFYAQRNAECNRYYDEWLVKAPGAGPLLTEALGYKAGALFRLGRPFEAAYAYSRRFSAQPSASDYTSFSWCVHRFSQQDRARCMAMARTNREKGDMLALFLLGSNVPDAASLDQLYRYGATQAVQEVLAVREVNKIERNYLTPLLHKQKGGMALAQLYMDWDDTKPARGKWLAETKPLIDLYITMAGDGQIRNRGLFATVAAQLSYITRQYDRTDSLLTLTATLPATAKLRDQQRLTGLLVTISRQTRIDTDFEARLAPSLQWLHRKAAADSPRHIEYSERVDHLGQWRQLYRNVLAIVLAKRYHEQADSVKEMLCIGAAEQLSGDVYWPVSGTQGLLRDRESYSDLTALYRLKQDPAKTDWEKFLCAWFPIRDAEIRSIIAVAATRDHRFHEALQWMHSVRDTAFLRLGQDPFADLLYDCTNCTFRNEKGSYTRRAFLAEMARLMNKERANGATAKDYYRLATGYYNMTYFGRAWKMVKYYRSGTYWENKPEYHIPFDRDYYECRTAEGYFRKAMDASRDANFRARCLFMMAKCAQKQLPADLWDPANREPNTARQYAAAKAEGDRYFSQLMRQYGNTPFYGEAYSSCSYLRDFVYYQMRPVRLPGRSPSSPTTPAQKQAPSPHQ